MARRKADINLLLFGGCALRGPLIRSYSRNFNRSIAAWNDVPASVACMGPPFMTYTLGEMLQTWNLYRGNRYLPTELRPFCGIKRPFAPDPESSLASLDGVLIEPATSTEIEFEGYYLNRSPVLRMLTPFKRQSREIGRLAASWYQAGIVGMDADLARSTGERLAQALPAAQPDRELTAAILRNARGRRRDVRGGIEQLRKAIHVPIGIVTYTWQFMPDGRPISWPAGFYGEVLAAARELGILIYEPRTIVQRNGVQVSLRVDRRHYRDDFMPYIAKSLVEFAQTVVSQSQRSSTESDERLEPELDDEGAGGSAVRAPHRDFVPIADEDEDDEEDLESIEA